LVFFSPITPPPPSSTLFPYTTLFRSELVDRRGRERLLVFGDPLAADPLEVADRGGESERAFDVRRPRLKLVRDLVVGGMIVPHSRDYPALSVVRPPCREQLWCGHQSPR